MESNHETVQQKDGFEVRATFTKLRVSQTSKNSALEIFFFVS